MTAAYSPVASGRTLRELHEAQLLDRYLLLIATQVLKCPQDYYWIRNFKGVVIMDNGVIEDGTPASVKALMEAARMVKADYIVLPDVLNDGVQTVYQASKAFLAVPNIGYSPSTVGVVQGTNSIEAFLCATTMMYMGVDMIALPRVLTDNSDIGTRVHLVDRINEFTDGKTQMLLLGFSNKPEDDRKAASRPNVFGIDSAAPVWLGRQQRYWRYSNPNVILSRPRDFWDNHHVNDQVIRNVVGVREWLTSA